MHLRSGQIVSRPRLKDGSTVTIRTPRSGDVDELLAFINGLVKEDAMVLANKPFKRKEEVRWLRDTLKGLKTGKKIYLVAEVNGKIVGGTEITRDSGKSEHVGGFGISIKDGYRNAGLGTALANEVIKQAKKSGFKLVTLEVFECNPRAIHTYEKVGFRRVGRIPKKLYHKGRYVGGIQMAQEISRME
jgi:RimJ/RimL family protein N-acetyltransferase